MTVRTTPEADAQIEARRAWWLAHREKAPGRFDEELAEALAHIGEAPRSFAVFTIRGGQPIRRRLMPRSRCHVYFAIDEAHGEVWVVAAGGGQRGALPAINLPPTL